MQDTLQQIKQQTSFAEDQDRPWIKIEDITINRAAKGNPVLSFFTPPASPAGSNGLAIQLEFHIKNIGRGVAQNVSVYPALIFDSQMSPASLSGDGELRACTHQGWQPPVPFPPLYRSAIFPGEPATSLYGALTIFDTSKINHLTDKAGDFLLVTVIGCISYQQPRPYQTIAVFHVIGPKDQFIEVNKPLTSANMHLLRDAAYEYAQ